MPKWRNSKDQCRWSTIESYDIWDFSKVDQCISFHPNVNQRIYDATSLVPKSWLRGQEIFSSKISSIGRDRARREQTWQIRNQRLEQRRLRGSERSRWTKESIKWWRERQFYQLREDWRSTIEHDEATHSAKDFIRSKLHAYIRVDKSGSSRKYQLYSSERLSYRERRWAHENWEQNWNHEDKILYTQRPCAIHLRQ